MALQAGCSLRRFLESSATHKHKKKLHMHSFALLSGSKRVHEKLKRVEFFQNFSWKKCMSRTSLLLCKMSTIHVRNVKLHIIKKHNGLVSFSMSAFRKLELAQLNENETLTWVGIPG